MKWPVLEIMTHGEMKFFCTRKAETPHRFHSRWWWAQSRSTSNTCIQCCFHADENRGVPSPKWLRLHGRWVNAVTTSGSACLIWKRGDLSVKKCSKRKFKSHQQQINWITLPYRWLWAQMSRRYLCCRALDTSEIILSVMQLPMDNR